MRNGNVKRLLSLLLAIALVLPAVYGGSASAAEATSQAQAKNSTFKTYFNDIYENLTDDNHVFRTLTYHEFDYLLSSEGTYVVLVGGAWDADTQAAIGHINDVAKEYGITKIHNFDPRLDGKTSATDITDNANNSYTRRYVDLANKYLTNLDVHSEGTDQVNYTYTGNVGNPPISTTISGEAAKLRTPFLFAYNKNHQQSGSAAPIISSVESIKALNEGGVESYKAGIRAVFDAISPEGTKLADYDVFTNQEYIPGSYNRFAGTTIFDESDGEIVIDPLTLDELEHTLDSNGTYVFLIGCSWCPNTRAIAKYVNTVAKQYGVDTVYNWDTKLDGGVGAVSDPQYAYPKPDSSNFYQTRATGHANANLYVDLVKGYLTNLKAEYSGASGNAGHVVKYTNAQGNEVVADKLQAPYVFVYNKNNKDADGNSAPILGHVELMYSWENIQPNYDNGTRYNIYVDGLKRLFSRLESVPTTLVGVAPTSASGSNRQITGSNSALEYRLKGSESFISAPAVGTVISGLAAGSYEVRYKSKSGVNGPVKSASDHVLIPYPPGQSVEVVIPAYTPSPGGDGGGNPPIPIPLPTAPPVDSNTDDDGIIEGPIVVAIPGTTDPASGSTVAVISKEETANLLDKVKKNASDGKPVQVELKVKPDVKSTSIQVTLAREAFNELAKAGHVQIRVDVDLGSVSFDFKALQAISENKDDGDISFILSASELTDEGKAVLGDRPVYDLNVFAGDEAVSTFGGSKVHVSIPYKLQSGEDAHSVIVYYVKDSGELETVRGHYHAATGTINFKTPHFSQYIIGYNKVAFDDVSELAWYSEAVGFLAARSITNGTDSHHYSPSDSVTRGQFIVLLLKAFGIAPDADGASNFVDAGDAYYTNYLSAAKRLGIATGIGENKFDPTTGISRQDLFTLLHRALVRLGELPIEKSNADATTFSDANEISVYAQEAVKALVEGNIIGGSDSKLYPSELATRAQVAQVIYNLLTNS